MTQGEVLLFFCGRTGNDRSYGFWSHDIQRSFMMLAQQVMQYE